MDNYLRKYTYYFFFFLPDRILAASLFPKADLTLAIAQAC
jgi:hypothetical protein